MVDIILSYISFSVILDLPLDVQIPGLLLLAYLAYRAIRATMALKPVRAITSILMFVIVTVILSRFGNAIATMIDGISAQ